jgi:hypothetical protein
LYLPIVMEFPSRRPKLTLQTSFVAVFLIINMSTCLLPTSSLFPSHQFLNFISFSHCFTFSSFKSYLFIYLIEYLKTISLKVFSYSPIKQISLEIRQFCLLTLLTIFLEKFKIPLFALELSLAVQF